MSDSSSPQATTTRPLSARWTLGRTNAILLALLVVQGLLAAFTLAPRRSEAQAGPLLPDLQPEQVTSLRVADGTGQEVALERTDDGWVLAGTDGFPANAAKITTTLSSLLELNTDRLVTRTAGSHRQLQVAHDAFARRITLGTAAGEHTVLLGSSAGAGATHFRLDGEDATYLTSAIATHELDTNPSGWIDVAYVRVPVEQITRLTLTNANGTFEFTKDQNANWTLEDLEDGEQVQAESISSLVSRAASVNLAAPLGTAEKPEYGMAQPAVTLTLAWTDDGGSEQYVELILGSKQDGSDAYFAKSSASPYYVTIPAFTGDELAGKQRSDFIAPTPETSAGAEPVVPVPPDVGLDGAQLLTETGAITAAAEVTGTSIVTPSGSE